MGRKRRPRTSESEGPPESPDPPEASQARARPYRRRWLLLVPLLLVAAGAVALFVLSRDEYALPFRGVDRREIPAEFVGSVTCANCHAGEFEEWTGSHHDLAMMEASPETVLGDFDDTTFLYGGIETRFFRRGERFFVRTEGPDGELHDYPVRYTFGWEPLQQYLIEFPAGRLQALSIAWDSRPAEAGGQRWLHMYPGEGIEHTDELHWTGRMQNWNFMCADCHSTGLRKGYDPAGERFATTWAEINVGCEGCHGPGSEHVAWARAVRVGRDLRWPNIGLTTRLDEREGVTWSFPAGSPIAARSQPRAEDREIEVCAQCHARRAQIADDYYPGRGIHDHYTISLLMPGLYHPDGQQLDEVYIHGSYLQSRMYHAGVTCSDCHNPHTARLRAPENQVCGQCHLASAFDTPAHHHHQPGSVGSRCAECHMPESTYMVVDPRRDHSIRIPRPDLTDEMGVPNACNRCHDDRPAAWAAAAVQEWYGQPEPGGFERFARAFHADETDAPDAAQALLEVAGDEDHAAIVRASALARLADRPSPAATQQAAVAALDEDPLMRRAALEILENAPERERLAVATPLLSDAARSVRLQAAWVLAPVANALIGEDHREAFTAAADEFAASQAYNADRPESRTTLGTFYMQLARYQEAERELRAAIRQAPNWVPAYANLADLYRIQGRERQAEEILREGLRAAAENATLRHALGLALVRQQRIPEALEQLERAAELAPDDARMAYVYAVALHSTGRVTEAIRTLEAAHAHAPRDRDIIFALATFHRDAGNLARAVYYAELLVETFPGDSEARQLLESLG